LRHISKKRQAGAAKVMYFTALTYNLKKYLSAGAPSNKLDPPSPCRYPVTPVGA
jgi:hypothetical protein